MTHWQPPDLDEIRPDRFVINNDKVRPLLRGEGVTLGKFFELGTWRRDGLIARIRERNFNVRTLADRVAALPSIGRAKPLGAVGLRVLSTSKERIAMFDPATLHWRDQPVIDVGGKPAVELREGAALRRRKSRGHSDYYLATLAPKDEINFVPATETAALLHAYAQIASSDSPAVVRFSEQADAYVVPHDQAIMPPPHADVLDLLAHDKAARWTFPKIVIPLVEDVLGKLGMHLDRHA